MQKDVSIIVFGDSVAYGVGCTEKCGWVNGMRLAFEKGVDYNLFVYNLSIPGETTNDILTRFDCEVRARYDASINNIIVFAIGLNDSSTCGTLQRVPYNIFALNIEKLIYAAKKFTPNVGFVGLTPVDEKVLSKKYGPQDMTYKNSVIQKYDECIRDLAEKNNCQYTNLMNYMKPTDFVDGIHPNVEGHKKICDRIIGERRMH